MYPNTDGWQSKWNKGGSCRHFAGMVEWKGSLQINPNLLWCIAFILGWNISTLIGKFSFHNDNAPIHMAPRLTQHFDECKNDKSHSKAFAVTRSTPNWAAIGDWCIRLSAPPSSTKFHILNNAQYCWQGHLNMLVKVMWLCISFYLMSYYFLYLYLYHRKLEFSNMISQKVCITYFF